uniref:Transgelin n=1 Tax=Pelodiscus sinensis TaxID=13735 RepID=K7F296_PELSI
MANKGPSYGLSRDVQSKIEKKYDDELEEGLVEWIVGQCGPGGGRPDRGRPEAGCWLLGTVVLSELVNSLYPEGSKPVKIPKPPPTMVFKQMEQVAQFLKAAEDYGVVKTDIFQTVDLFEGCKQDRPCCDWRVIPALRWLALAETHSPAGNAWSLRRKAQECKRDFSDGQLKEGKNVIGLQMGSNKGASQAGMTGYGRPRQIIG